MKELNVKFEFDEISQPQSDDLRLVVEILGQRFFQFHRVVVTGNEISDIKRHKAQVFGDMLIKIGDSIRNQALYGKPGKITVNGNKLILF